MFNAHREARGKIVLVLVSWRVRTMKIHSRNYNIRPILAIIVFIGVPLTLLVLLPAMGWIWITIPTGNTAMITIAKDTATLFLLLIELCAIAIAILAIIVYFQRYGPSAFIFKGFSNASKLTEIDHIPVDFNNLAREELAYQFLLIYQKLDNYYGKRPETKNLSDFARQSSADRGKRDSRHINISDLYTEKTRPGDNVEWPLPDPEVLGILDPEQAKRLVHYLEKTIEALKDGELSNLKNKIERNAPKEIAPLMNFIDALLPARTITVTCHLQWRDNRPGGRIGITFQVTDSKKKGGFSFTRTIWWERAPSAHVCKKLTERYIALLEPAMRWLVLLYWEQKILLDTDKKSLSAFLYLLGTLYYDCTDQFPAYSEFFSQQAEDRLRKVASHYPNLSLPYFVRAEMNFWKAEKAKKSEERHSLFQHAIHFYNLALGEPNWEEFEQDAKNFITIRRALAVLGLEDAKLLEDTKNEIEHKLGERGELTTFYSSVGEMEECSLYLSNLATWYADLATWYANLATSYEQQNEEAKKEMKGKEEEAETMARRYSIYSLVRNPRLLYNKGQEASRYKEFQRFFFEKLKEGLFIRDDSKELWKILEENRQEISTLATRWGKEFSDGVEKLFGRWCITSTSPSTRSFITNDANILSKVR